MRAKVTRSASETFRVELHLTRVEEQEWHTMINDSTQDVSTLC